MTEGSNQIWYDLITFCLMLIGFVLLEILANTFSNVFGLSGETKVFYISAMRIITFSFLFAGANIAF